MERLSGHLWRMECRMIDSVILLLLLMNFLSPTSLAEHVGFSAIPKRSSSNMGIVEGSCSGMKGIELLSECVWIFMSKERVGLSC